MQHLPCAESMRQNTWMQNAGNPLSHVKALEELGPLSYGNDSIQEILLLDIGQPLSINWKVVFGKIDMSDLCAADTMFVDGTFKMAPAIFRQIFTIHIGPWTQQALPLLSSGRESCWDQCHDRKNIPALPLGGHDNWQRDLWVILLPQT